MSPVGAPSRVDIVSSIYFGGPMKYRLRSWKRTSLRTSLFLLTAACILLGWHVHTARTQRTAVARLEAAGVAVVYGLPEYRFAPQWAVETLGRDHFATPIAATLLPQRVDFTDHELLKQIALELRRLRGLRSLEIIDEAIACNIGPEELEILLTGLDQIERVQLANMHGPYITAQALRPLRDLAHLSELELIWVQRLVTPEPAALDSLAEIDSLQLLTLPWHARGEAARLSTMHSDWQVQLLNSPRLAMGPKSIIDARAYWEAFSEPPPGN